MEMRAWGLPADFGHGLKIPFPIVALLLSTSKGPRTQIVGF